MTKEKAQIVIGNIPINPEVLDDYYDITEYQEAKAMAIEALEQESITWVVGKDNCQVAVRNMPIDKMLKICAIIGEEETQSKMGHWIDTGSGQECSECKEIQYGYDNFRYFCPNCGANMRGENNGE